MTPTLTFGVSDFATVSIKPRRFTSSAQKRFLHLGQLAQARVPLCRATQSVSAHHREFTFQLQQFIKFPS